MERRKVLSSFITQFVFFVMPECLIYHIHNISVSLYVLMQRSRVIFRATRSPTHIWAKRNDKIVENKYMFLLAVFIY